MNNLSPSLIKGLMKVLTKASILLMPSLLLLLSACENDTSLMAKSVVYCAEGSPQSFNPQTLTSGTTIDAISNQLYDRLIGFSDEDSSIVPALAKSWHVTRDGKKITFYLRKNVDFHQTDYFTPTRLLNADDVIFSFKRILDTQHEYHAVSGANYPFFQSVDFNRLVNKVEKINDYTVRFTLNRADSSFLANLATDFAVILSAEYAQQLSQRATPQKIDLLPVGTGPFKFKEYRVASLIRYYRHDKYWQHKVPIEQLVFDITPSNTGRLTKLLTNECDVIAYPIAHDKIRENPNLTLDAVTSLNVSYLGFNTQRAPFNNKLVRKAIASAINKQAIIDTVYFGQAEIAKSILPKASWAFDETIEGQVFSIEKAKQLLIQAGYPDGFTMDIWAVPVQRAYNPNALRTAKLIQADLQQIGVTVNIVTYEWTTFLRHITRGEHQSVLLGWSADHPDPDNFFTPLLSCASMETGLNRAFWCNKAFDDVIQKSLLTTNINQRKTYYGQALAILGEEVPLLPIAFSKRYQARSNKITGNLLPSYGGINFSKVNKN
jgi:cationic peptide transport system substrate-binding protein